MKTFDEEKFKALAEEVAINVSEHNLLYGCKIGELGEASVFCRAWDKMARLEELLWNRKFKGKKELTIKEKEAVDNAWLDLAGYSLLYLYYFSGEELEKVIKELK